jgi:enamine deaminase RidA (YjgF/YER057c/UK114 family)
MKIEARLQELGIELPEPRAPIANFVNAVRTGNLLFLAGNGPGVPGKPLPTGKVGRDFSIEQAARLAREVGINLIAVMKAELGDLDRVARIVKVLGMVNCTSEYGSQPEVINGCSDLFVEVFGERGKHARSAVGMGSLPRGIPVEIEVIVEVEADPVPEPTSAPMRAPRAAATPAAVKSAPKKKPAPKKVAKKKKR